MRASASSACLLLWHRSPGQTYCKGRERIKCAQPVVSASWCPQCPPVQCQGSSSSLITEDGKDWSCRHGGQKKERRQKHWARGRLSKEKLADWRLLRHGWREKQMGSQPSARVLSTPLPPFSYWSPSLFLRLAILVRFFKNLFSYHEINFFRIFAQVELRVLPVPPAPIFSHCPKLPFLFWSSWIYLYSGFKINRYPYSFLSPILPPKPHTAKTWAPSHPKTIAYCLFEVCASVTDTIFNCTYRHYKFYLICFS